MLVKCNSQLSNEPEDKCLVILSKFFLDEILKLG